MDEEQKEWSQQYTSNIGTKEILRLGCAMLIWLFMGVGLGLALDFAGYSDSSNIFVIFLVLLFAFPIITRSWTPAYSLVRKILGNENLPTEPMPRSIVKILRQPLAWWIYFPGLWNWTLFLLLSYVVIRYFSK